jgi:hypothetical protein
MKMNKSIVFIIMILTGLVFVFSSEAREDVVDIKNIKHPRPGVTPNIDFGNIPLYFITNKGQVNKKATFYAKASRYTLWLTREGLVFDSTCRVKDKNEELERGHGRPITEERMQGKGKFARDVSRLIFLKANKNPVMVPMDEAKLKVNYFKGNDKSKWHCDVPTSKAVLYKNLYKGIDLKVYGLEKLIEYDWIVTPKGNPRQIKFQYKNVKGSFIDKEGNLVIETDFGELMHKKPVSYQQTGIERKDVNVVFKKISENTYGFEVGAYDRSRELIIDPVVLAYSTYLGGGAGDQGYDIAVDADGNVYLTGYTNSTDFPVLNQYQTYQGDSDVFVTKLDTTRSGISTLLYSTYLGGGDADYGRGIAIDTAGNAYVTGSTDSTDFPTINQYQTDPGDGKHDAFVIRLDPTLSGISTLLYSTYLGGDNDDYGNGIAIDAGGNAYVTGTTRSTDFPTRNQYQKKQGGNDAFVTRLDTTRRGTSSLIYSTYLGDIEVYGHGIAADAAGNAYVTGLFDTELNEANVFVFGFDTTRIGASSLIFFTWLGGTGYESGSGIAIDAGGNVYVTGYTNSTDFPTVNQYQTYQGGGDLFVTRLDTTQSGAPVIIYSTYLGGESTEYGRDIAVDAGGNAYVTGTTWSADFPAINQYQTYHGDGDVFVTGLDTNRGGASAIIYSTYLGGGDADRSNGIAVDAGGNVYVTGYTDSTDFPVIDQYQGNQGGRDAFVARISASPPFIPVVETNAASGITATTAASGGNVISNGGAAVTARGVCWSTSANPTTADSHTSDGNGTGTFTSALTGLTALTTYHVRAYAVNSQGTSYGIDMTFTTRPIPPTVTTTGVSNVTATSTAISGNVTSDGGALVTARGICYSTSENPTTADSHTSDGNGTGTFTGWISGLTAATTYHARAYAVNSEGTSYSSDITFTTQPSLPVITSSAVSAITATTAASGGNVISNGGAAVTARGVCWRISANPRTTDSHTTDGTGTGVFSSSLTGLIPNTTYYLRSYAVNSAGISYGNQRIFTTSANPVISGTVLNGTIPIEGVTITFSHDGHTETTGADGNYSYTIPHGTSTTVTASKPGYTFEPSEYSYTNFTEDKPNQDFTVSHYVSVIITNPQNSDTVSGTVIIDAEVSSMDANVTQVEFYIDGAPVKQDTAAPYRYRWETNSVPNGGYSIKAKAYHSNGLTNQHEITVNVNNSTEPPHMVLNRSRLNFGAVIGGSHTGSQTFLIGNSGGSRLNWTASISHPWLEASPSSGTANTLVTVSVDPTGISVGSYRGTVTLTAAAADNSPISIYIFLVVKERVQELPLFGNFDSPKDGAAVSSSIPITGWAVDDIEVTSVKIFRNPQPLETGLVYIGDAIFVEGARTDVEIQYNQNPKNYRAGWGYQMLTNTLPKGGNGTFVITAVATDSSGNEITLGSRTITCDNANAVKPFGTIDTPAYGGDAAGMDFVNFGWALTPQPNTIPTDGSTIRVWVDGAPLAGNPVYNGYREDIATMFPGYKNSDGAVGYYYLDTTLYANGMHTIAWSVTDDAGNTDGIGSRYFRVLNVGNGLAGSASANGYRYKWSSQHLPISISPIYLKTGYNTGVDGDPHRETVYPDKEGVINMVINENERIEIEVGNHCRGFILVDGQLRGLPVGSTMDMKKGVFYWQPGPGFIGEYRFVFVERELNGRMNRRKINITIRPKY